MTDQLPAVFVPGELIASTDTYVPALIAVLGDQASVQPWCATSFSAARVGPKSTYRSRTIDSARVRTAPAAGDCWICLGAWTAGSWLRLA